MFFWFLMLFFTLLMPGVMVLFGFLWKNHPPKDINGLYGYRTAMSCKNQETWELAHQTAGKLWRGWGLATLAVSAVGFPLGSLALAGWEPAALGRAEYADPVGYLSLVFVAVQMAVLVGSIFPVERALKRAFDQEGNRRS